VIAIAWNNGSHNPDGNGYGIKINVQDRDRYFRAEWKTILLTLEGETGILEININNSSFWNSTCLELISVCIGVWFIKHVLAPWPNGNPPHLRLESMEGKHFRLKYSK
jgi:hypothetical protein